MPPTQQLEKRVEWLEKQVMKVAEAARTRDMDVLVTALAHLGVATGEGVGDRLEAALDERAAAREALENREREVILDRTQALLEEGLALARRGNRDGALAKYAEAQAQGNNANSAHMQQTIARGVKQYLDRLDREVRQSPAARAKEMMYKGISLKEAERYAEAAMVLRQALEMFKKVHGDTPHEDLAACLNELAVVLWKQDNTSKEADKLGAEAIAISTKALGHDHATTVGYRADWA